MTASLIEELQTIGEVRQPGFILTIEGDNYRMEKTTYPFEPHFLSVSDTDEERLAEHWYGYQDNHSK